QYNHQSGQQGQAECNQPSLYKGTPFWNVVSDIQQSNESVKSTGGREDRPGDAERKQLGVGMQNVLEYATDHSHGIGGNNLRHDVERLLKEVWNRDVGEKAGKENQQREKRHQENKGKSSSVGDIVMAIEIGVGLYQRGP